MIEAGRAFQQEQGFTQWTPEYPNRETIREDILRGKGYALKVDGELVGYLCLDFEGEPAYSKIEGHWNTGEPYGVIHRMAFDSAARGKGLADAAFALAEGICRQRDIWSVRVDTDFPNLRMQHILKKNGYENCGVVIFQGSGKLAFEKALR